MHLAEAPPFVPQIRLYREWLHTTRGLSFESYDALWRWSTTDLAGFWQSVWDYFALQSPTRHSVVLANNIMPGAVWFRGAQVNYARQVLRHVAPAHEAGQLAIISRDERGGTSELSWPELRRQVASLALHLKAHGVLPGDRVAAYLPNTPQTMVACLATVSIGAVWSVCAPDMRAPAVLDRFRQIEPKVLIACDGVRYAGRDQERLAVVNDLCAGLPTLRHVVRFDHLGAAALPAHASPLLAQAARLADATAQDDAEVASFEPMWLPFDHPLWILYSSGTTGLPKPIVHGHGGIMVVSLAMNTLHNDLGCSYHPNSRGERFHWYSSTDWMMWNVQLGGLLGGTTCALFDGRPSGPKEAPDWTTLWRFAAQAGVSFFGAGAAFYAGCLKAGVDLSRCGDLSRIRALGATGSPLAPQVQDWGREQFARIARTEAQRDIWWSNISGGTDFCSAFIGGHRELPQAPGVLQCRLLGCAVEAWSEQGEPVHGEVGELVCTQPIPSMPLFFWGDTGNARYLASYFRMYPPGHGRRPGGGDLGPEAGSVWRHGDWLRVGAPGRADAGDDNQGCVIYGRSDATLNRHGLRMGTSELYSAVEGLPEVMDSLVVDLEYLGRDSWMPLFVTLRPGAVLDDALQARIRQAIREALSPRFTPDAVYQVAEIPRTLSGKKQELPVKKLLLGQPLETVVSRDAMANPASIDWFVTLAEKRLAATDTAAAASPA